MTNILKEKNQAAIHNTSKLFYLVELTDVELFLTEVNFSKLLWGLKETKLSIQKLSGLKYFFFFSQTLN